MARIVIICASPTKWDQEDRIVGNHSLPLVDSAKPEITEVVNLIPGIITAVYLDKTCEASSTVGRMIGSRFKLRMRHSPELGEWNLGLWQGLVRSDLRMRFESSFPQWEQNPMSIKPPEGESLEQAIERVRHGLVKILRRNRGVSIALPLRPMAMQIVVGVLQSKSAAEISANVLKVEPQVSLELDEAQVAQFIT